MIILKEVKTTINFLLVEEINSQAIDEVIDFVKDSNEDALVSNIKIEMLNNKPYRLSVGINLNGSVLDIKILPLEYYYFNKSELTKIDNIENFVL